MTKSVDAYISNHTAMPGNIKSVEVFINSGASAKTTYDCAFSTTECTSATEGIGAVNITGGNSNIFSNMTGEPATINVEGKYFCITLGNANNGQVLKLVITCEDPNSGDTRTSTTTTITGNETTLYMGDAATTPTATVMAGETAVNGATVAWSSTNEDVATINASTGAITLTGIGTTTIKAEYAGTTTTYKPSNASYTLTVYGSATTMAELQAICTTYGNTATPAKVTMNNVYVTAIYNNKTVHISDGTNGVVIYDSSHGFSVGDKLSCTGLVMNVLNYNSWQPEISGLTATTDGLTVVSDQTITPTNMTVSEVSTANYSTVVKITGLTYVSGSNPYFKDASENKIYYNDRFSASPTLVNNSVYDVTGVINITNTSPYYYICPRTAADVVEKVLLDNAITGIEDSYELDLVTDGGISTLDLSAATATSGGAVTFAVKSATQEATEYELDGAELTVAQKGTIVITASVAANSEYKAATTDITVNVLDAPALTTTSKTIAFGETYTLTAGVDFDADGTVTLASDNTSIATVSTLTITPVAVGTTNINVTFAKGTTTLAGSGVIALTVAAPDGQEIMPVETLFKETFDNLDGTGGNDGGWSGSIAATAYSSGADNTWTFENAYKASKCVKMGTGSKLGKATTPALALEAGTTYTLTFRAGAWSGKSTNLKLSMTNGTLSQNSVTMKDAAFDDFEVTITEASAGATITFEGNAASNSQFFLDEVLITKSMATTSVTLAASGYASYCSEYPLDFTTTDGYKAYYVSAADKDAVTFTQITGKIKGGQGIILYGTPSAECTLTYCESDNELVDNMLVGTLAPKNIATVEGEYTNFGLSGGKFVKITSGNVPANKAYLPVKTSDIATARELAIIFDDATGIDSVTREALMNGKIYNLQGQEVKTATKGVFIVNGKKVFLK